MNKEMLVFVIYSWFLTILSIADICLWLFNDAISNSGYTSTNETIIINKIARKIAKGNNRGVS